MRVPRLFHDGSLDANTIQLSTATARHAIQVLRLAVGSKLIVFNGNGHDYHASIKSIKKSKVDINIYTNTAICNESAFRIELGIALIKNDRLDLTIQKATELGVTSITPVNSEYSNITINHNKQDKKHQHWQGVIQHACEQCGRASLPNMNPITRVEDFISAQSKLTTLVLNPLSDTAMQSLPNEIEATKAIRLLIGPEGGFSEKERQMFENKNIVQAKLGPRILRAETAAISAITLLQHKYGDLN